ncbi:hypothetical protein [Psychromonas hadalis]|uniref:hypothetical protein n=1 Tax=Psychromonas hadalis TaxID=211669 RepID=UPI0003B3F510|nr:hypothetical protein [Psychromonas hadalis]
MPITILLSLLTGKAKKPFIIILLIGAVLTALTAGYFYVKAQGYENGYTVAEHKYLQEKQKAVISAIKQVNRKNQTNSDIAKAYWQNELAKKPKIETIEKRIIEYVEVNNSDECLLNDDELFILTDLIDIANGTTTAQADHRPSPVATLPTN